MVPSKRVFKDTIRIKSSVYQVYILLQTVKYSERNIRQLNLIFLSLLIISKKFHKMQLLQY